MAGPRDPAEQEAYDRLLACWLIAVLEHRDRIKDEHHDALRTAGLSLRRIARTGLHPSLRTLLDTGEGPPAPQALAKVLSLLVAQDTPQEPKPPQEEQPARDPMIHVLVGLERAMAFLLEVRAPRPRAAGTLEAGSEPTDDVTALAPVPVPGQGGGDADPNNPTGTATTSPAPASALAAPAEADPTMPGRAGASRRHGPSVSNLPASLSLPQLGGPGSFTRRAQRARAQTLNLSRLALLTPYDGTLLATHLPDAPSAVRLAVTAALYGGPLFELLTQSPVVDAVPGPDAPIPECCWLRADVPGFLIRNHVNDDLPAPVDGQCAAPVAPDLLLPLDPHLPGAAQLIGWAAKRDAGAPLLEPAMVQAARAWLDELRITHGGALRLTRVIQQLPRHLTNLTGDRLLGQLLAPAPLPSALRARMAYRQYPAGAIAQWHARACQGLATWLGRPTNRNHSPLPLRPGHVVGSRRASPAAAFADWGERLRALIPRLGRGRLSWDGLRDHSNAYVTYVLTACLCTGGVRISKEGLATAGLVAGMRLVDDKARAKRQDSAGGIESVQNVRIVPATPQDLRQAQWWKRHRDVLMRRIKAPLPTWPWLGEREGHVIAVTPKLWRALAAPPMAPNGARHYLATALLAHGLAADRVNQWLGHAATGEETGNPWSAAEPLAAPWEQAIWNTVVAAMGFAPVEGLGRG